MLSALLTVKLVRLQKGEISRFRLINLLVLSLSMVMFYVIIPYAFNFFGLYPLIMPFPWSTAPFQIIMNGHYFSISYRDQLGPNGIDIALIIVALYHIAVVIGTLLIGRRWHCSMLCTFNGGHAEASGDALPLHPLNKKRPKSKAFPPKMLLFFVGIQIFMVIFNIFLVIIWLDLIIDGKSFISEEQLLSMELTKYMVLELFLLFLFWLTAGGRAYCRYCAAGVFIGLIARASGQEITTNLTKCTQCGSCNDACKMSIDIMKYAKNGDPVKSINCVGCGLCVDACPTHNLAYNTNFLKKMNSKK